MQLISVDDTPEEKPKHVPKCVKCGRECHGSTMYIDNKGPYCAICAGNIEDKVRGEW